MTKAKIWTLVLYVLGLGCVITVCVLIHPYLGLGVTGLILLAIGGVQPLAHIFLHGLLHPMTDSTEPDEEK